MTTTNSNGSTFSTVSVLDKHLTLISISVGTFGGYRRATRDAIAKLGGNLPKSQAITEGSIKVFPSEPLAPAHTIRRGLFRAMAKRGIKALGSSNVFAIPRVELAEAEKEVKEAQAEFSAFVTKLDANYDTIFEAHAVKHGKESPEAEELIRQKKFSKAEAIAKLNFSSAVFRIQAEVRDGQDAEAGIQGIVQGLGRQLFEEVAHECTKLLTKNDAFTKHNRAGQKTLRPLHALVAKMSGLVFLDERNINGAVKLVNDALATLPRQGYIEDSGSNKPFSTLRRLVEIMSDADDLVNAAGRIGNGMSAEDVLFPPKPVVPVSHVKQGATQPTVSPQPALAAPAVVKPTVAPSTLPPLPLAAIPVVPPPAPARRQVAMF